MAAAGPSSPEVDLGTTRNRLMRFGWFRRLAAIKRLRRGPASALRAAAAERADRRAGRIPPATPRRREVASVVWFAVGPGRNAELLDSIDSVIRSDGDATQVVVIDDSSVDSREAIIRERHPAIDVLRMGWPSGGPPNMWKMSTRALEHALDHYAFDLWVKMDSDALVTGPRFAETTLARLAVEPQAGVAGSYRIRCDGGAEDPAYHAMVLSREIGRDRRLAAARNAALAGGWREADIVQGGVCCLTREACVRLREGGWLGWRRPWHSQVSEDLALSLFTLATGLRVVSIGDPDGIFAVTLSGLALPKDEIADGPWVAAHSTKAGLDGESETELRKFFSARRAEWT